MGLIYFVYRKTKLVLTNNKIYGVYAFGKRIDLPIDSVSSIGIGLFNCIVIGTSSMKIKFFFIKNRDDIFNETNKLLSNRESNKNVVETKDSKEVKSTSNLK